MRLGGGSLGRIATRARPSVGGVPPPCGRAQQEVVRLVLWRFQRRHCPRERTPAFRIADGRYWHLADSLSRGLKRLQLRLKQTFTKYVRYPAAPAIPAPQRYFLLPRTNTLAHRRDNQSQKPQAMLGISGHPDNIRRKTAMKPR